LVRVWWCHKLVAGRDAPAPYGRRDCPGLDQEHLDPRWRQFRTQASCHANESVLSGGVRTQHRPSDTTADRPDHDNACLAALSYRGEQRGQHHLGDEQLPDQIDLQLTAEHRDRQILQRAGQGRPGVVHQPHQRT
jgi:hypothetical protein